MIKMFDLRPVILLPIYCFYLNIKVVTLTTDPLTPKLRQKIRITELINTNLNKSYKFLWISPPLYVKNGPVLMLTKTYFV